MKAALIVGAGVAGRELLEQIKKHKSLNVRVAGFVDDNPNKKNKKILGVPVLGGRKDLKKLIVKEKIDEVFIAIPSASGKEIREIISNCVSLNVAFRVVPRTLDIVQGKVLLDKLKDVAIEDLIGRPIVQLEQKQFQDFFKNKVIMVTGAAGSIGSEITRQLINFNPSELILYDWWENGMFYITSELKNADYKNRGFKAVITPIIGDIKDKIKLSKIFSDKKIDVVFHAAAYKHVPLMEGEPSEAVKNNILGTYILEKVSKENHVKNFIFISTDKAVKPKSIMGATKLIAEGITLDMSKDEKTKFVAVRFGNVLDSFGSVVPTFKKQIAEGGPVTVTHKDVKRFFMSIPEAVQLIFKATILGKGGEIFMLDMGEPIRILDLAKLLIKLSGYVPDDDIKIVFTGLRPGEKLTEELFTDRENLIKTKNEKIFITRNLGLDVKNLSLVLNKLIRYSLEYKNKEVLNILREVVPTLNI